MSWSIRGIDDETREAAFEAARQSGQSVGEWLNEVIARRAAEQGVNPDREDDEAGDEELHSVADAVVHLTRRIRAMDASQRALISGLKDRLDEIEDNLARIDENAGRPERRAHSLRDVSAMVSALSRELDNADETARSMVEGLRGARRSGAPASPSDPIADAIRGLDERIQAMGGRTSTAETPARLEDVRARLDALLAAAPASGPIPSPTRAATLDSTLKALEARIDEAKARLAVSRQVDVRPQRSAEEEERVRRIEARLADISNRLAEPTPMKPVTPPRDDPPPRDGLSAAVEEISRRQRVLDERNGSALRRPQRDAAALEELRVEIAKLAEALPFDQGRLDAIANDLDALRAHAESGARQSTLTQIGATQDEVIQRLEALLDRTPDRDRFDAFGEEIAAIRSSLADSEGARAISRLEMRVNELARTVEAALNARHAAVESGNGTLAARLDELSRALDYRDREAERRLEGRFDEIASRIDGLLDRVAPADAVVDLTTRLETLARRMDQAASPSTDPVAALDEVKAEVAAMRREVAGRGAPGVDHLENEIRALADRLEAVARPDADVRQLSELEAQVAGLAADLEGSMPRASTLQQVEENLARLQASLSDNRRESVEAARSAARDAVRELAAGGIDNDLVRALRQDLDNLRHAAADTDPKTQTTLHSMHETLARIVGRLAGLEEAARETSPAAGAAVLPDDRPLEPGSGRPDLAALREIAASTGASSERRTGDRRADFIAAARRAAQAAATEAASAEREDKGEPRQSTFARIGQAIRSRRKPLILAAAAIVLAIGALHVFEGRLFGNQATADSPPRAKVAVATHPPAPATPTVASRVAPAKPTETSVTSKPGTPTIPRVADAALVAPASDGKAVLAFSDPEIVGSRFGGVFEAPEANGFAPKAKAPETSSDPAPGTVPAADGSEEPVLVAAGPDALRKAAAEGNPDAFFEIATLYAEGKGVSQDLTAAAEWYERAGNAGIAVAQYRLGSLYERGQGVKKDLRTAVDWYQRAADLGNLGAMHNLAVMMSEGVDGKPDREKALEWFLAAASYGVKDSQYNLGVIYARGLSIAPDRVEAYKWFAAAAAQGDADAAKRRDEVAAMLSADELAKARAAFSAWRPKEPIAEANTAPTGNWDGSAGVSAADQRALVKKIQALLADRGYDPGPADGFAGPKTQDAVRAFQRTVGIAETGRIDRSLVSALEQPG